MRPVGNCLSSGGTVDQASDANMEQFSGKSCLWMVKKQVFQDSLQRIVLLDVLQIKDEVKNTKLVEV